MSFNLAAPPGFRGLNPYEPVTVYQRSLPHWRQRNATYFVTFHLADALPAAKQAELASFRREWELRHPPPRDEVTWTEFARSMFIKVEDWMDAGYGACWFKQQPYASELSRAMLHFHQQQYDLGCFVVMANHCHLVIRLYQGFDLEAIIGAIKRVTANFVNKLEQRRGELWQTESYDRIIRNEEHLYRVVPYIGNNPRRAGMPKDAWRRWINPIWQAAGWDFAS
jgi:putative transposase